MTYSLGHRSAYSVLWLFLWQYFIRTFSNCLPVSELQPLYISADAVWLCLICCHRFCLFFVFRLLNCFSVFMMDASVIRAQSLELC